MNAAFSQIASANVFAFNLPPIMGLGQFGGPSSSSSQSLAGAAADRARRRGARADGGGPAGAAARQRIHDLWALRRPQINLKLRPRGRAAGAGHQHRRHLLGPADRHGRRPIPTTSTCSAAPGRSRSRPRRADRRHRQRTSTACAVRLVQRRAGAAARPLADVELITAPLVGHPLQQSALRVTLNGAPGARFIPRATPSPPWKQLAVTTLPAGYAYEWTGTALQEKAASGQTGFILGLAVVFAYLFPGRPLRKHRHPAGQRCSRSRSACSAPLAALYVSGARQQHLRPRSASSCLIALAAKNAILIIEFAMAETRARARTIVTAATTAAGLRFPRRDDDLLRLHPGPGAAGRRLGRRCRHPARGRHRRVSAA